MDPAAQTLTIESTAKGKTRGVIVHLKPGGKVVRFTRPTEPGKTGFVEQTAALTDLKAGWIVSVATKHEGDSRAGTMKRVGFRLVATAVVGGAMVASSAAIGVAQQPGKPRQPAQAPKAAPPGDHGTPEGWKFKWPKGDIAKGRQVFVKLECYSCHEVKGEKFPAPSDRGKVGPELSVMGPLHEAEYFAEAIINPSAIIEKGKGYQGADGSSKMPSFNDSLNVQELIDLVAFLRALKPPAGQPAGHRGH